MSHVFEADPDFPDGCLHCPLPKKNARHGGGGSAAFDGATRTYRGPRGLSENERIAYGIRYTAQQYAEFTANEWRKCMEELFPPEEQIAETHRVGRMFATFIDRKEIIPLQRRVASDEKRTHGHRIGCYRAGPCLQRVLVPA